MALTKQSWKSLPDGSPEQVIAHAAWRRSRGKVASMAYREIRRPNEALKAALLEAPPVELDSEEDYSTDEEDEDES